MSIIKSFAVGNGDMFYIEHNSDNFTILDCCLNDDNKEGILKEISTLSTNKGIVRFISTHPDNDHSRGLKILDDKIKIVNFYCVKNKATKEEETDDFIRYCELRDSEKAFYIYKGCARKWMNQSDEETGGRGSSGLNILWPDIENKDYLEALKKAEDGDSPNNISPVIKYSLGDETCVLWFGDLETEFMEKVKDELILPKASIIFAPHHGRDSGKIPESLLKKMNPDIIIIGEAPSQHLNYYTNYNTITQNSAGDIVFDCQGEKVHIFTSEDYSVNFLDDESKTKSGYYYLGTLNL